MKRIGIRLLSLSLTLLLMLSLSSCGGGEESPLPPDGGVDSANPAFNGTFRGDVTFTQGGEDFQGLVTIALTVGSPLSGTFTSERSHGTLSGTAEGQEATFTGIGNSHDQDCPISFEASVTLNNHDNSLSINFIEGTNCDGAFTVTGTLDRISAPSDPQAPDLVGDYTGTITSTSTHCDDPAYDGTYSLPVTVEISRQDDTSFSGAFVARGTVRGIRVSNRATFEGRVDTDGSVSGEYESELVLDGAFDSSGEGNFSGTATANAFNVSYSGRDTVGDSCDVEGRITATR